MLNAQSRRELLKGAAVVLAAAKLSGPAAKARAPVDTRGIVLVPEDLTLEAWPDLARRADLTTIALHHGGSPKAVVDAIRSERGQRFLARCKELGLRVEYELHAMKELLPRALFAIEPELFRVDDKGDRTPDANLCVSSRRALDLVAENGVALAKALPPTTGRYFLWGDDGAPWCRCPKCKDLTDSDQSLLMENRLLKALKTLNPRAQLAHLAYANTLAPPKTVKPEPGVFLEYAPINRRYDIPYEQQADPAAKDSLANLDANLKVFPAETAQMLEYWLDVSRFSGWKRPSVKLPWNRQVLMTDVATYRKRGIRNFTSFGAWIDADYRTRFGELDFLNEYGEGLRGGPARPAQLDWRKEMLRVHARFTGKRGSLAQFGDSITETRAFWSPVVYERKNAPAALERAFVKVRERMLPESWSGGKGPENGNQGGQTVQWALEHVDDWLKRLNPEMAVILFGTNDLSSIDSTEYRRRLTALTRKCLDNGTVVILTTIPPRHAMENRAAAFAEAARSVARDMATPLVDYHAEILKRRANDWDGAMDSFSAYRDYDVPTLISRDGVHPSYPARFQTDYSEEGLRSSGYTLRNYLTLLKVEEVIEALGGRR